MTHASTEIPIRERLRRFRVADTDRGASASTGEVSLLHYERLLEREAEAASVPVDLLKAICWYASGWRHYEPSGRILTTPTPHGTSYGCMQLNDVWHPDAFPAALAEAQASVHYAAKLLRWLFEQTQDWQRATIAFFGHDRRAEAAARRVKKYASQQPWEDRSRARTDSLVERSTAV